MLGFLIQWFPRLQYMGLYFTIITVNSADSWVINSSTFMTTKQLRLLQDGDYLIGAPGSLDRRGSVHKNKVIKSVFDDDLSWYDDPPLDDVPEQHPTLDDYLGLCVFVHDDFYLLFHLVFIIMSPLSSSGFHKIFPEICAGFLLRVA